MAHLKVRRSRIIRPLHLIDALPPCAIDYARWRWWRRWGWRWWRIHNRSRRNNHRCRTDYAIGNSRPYERSCHAPAAMSIMMTEMRRRCWPMMHRRRTAPKAARTASSMESTRSGMGKRHSCRNDGNQRNHRFLVHVFLFFLSLLTKNKETEPAESDTLITKKKSGRQTAARRTLNQTKHLTNFRTKRQGQHRHTHSMYGHIRDPKPHCGRGHHHACCRQRDSRYTPHIR